MIAATILSAGVSSRMGFPKALLQYRGRTFLQSILDVTAAVGISRRLVVLGPEPDRILSEHELRGVTLVTNDEMDLGPIGSIRASIEAIQVHPVDGLLVWPVDFPHVAVKTVELMIEAFRAQPDCIVVPATRGKRGHPVLFPRSVFPELAAASDTEGAREVVRAVPDRVVEVPVEDLAVIDDLNTPEAYRRLLKLEDKIKQ
jgi:molybdenum cofactor cytidylyltransferase